jgi:hypothetical protein
MNVVAIESIGRLVEGAGKMLLRPVLDCQAGDCLQVGVVTDDRGISECQRDRGHLLVDLLDDTAAFFSHEKKKAPSQTDSAGSWSPLCHFTARSFQIEFLLLLPPGKHFRFFFRLHRDAG